MGQSLVGAMQGNRLGHFEDIEFVQFHDRMLRNNHAHMYAPPKRMKYPSSARNVASAMLSERSRANETWGWKDPRTSLFLEFWHSIDPEIRYVFLYRDPYTVIDSLLRRGTDRRLRLMPWLAATAWLDYNRRIIEFFKNARPQGALINISGFNARYETATATLERHLGIKFAIPYTDVYRRAEIASKPSNRYKLARKLISSAYRRRLDTLYDELESAAHVPGTIN